MLRLKNKKTKEAVPEIPAADAVVEVQEPVVEPVALETPEQPEPIYKEQMPELPEAPQEIVGPWSVERVAIQEREVIYNSDTKESYTIEQVLVKLMNLLESGEE